MSTVGGSRSPGHWHIERPMRSHRYSYQGGEITSPQGRIEAYRSGSDRQRKVSKRDRDLRPHSARPLSLLPNETSSAETAHYERTRLKPQSSRYCFLINNSKLTQIFRRDAAHRPMYLYESSDVYSYHYRYEKEPSASRGDV